MPSYIEADKLMQDIRQRAYLTDNIVERPIYAMTLLGIQQTVDEQPTISPDEERGVAFWVDTQPHLDDSSYKKDGMAYYCSNCHHRAGKYKHRSYKFCPWCGARIVPKDTAIADMLPPVQNGEDKADLIEQMERFQEYAKGGSK